MITPEMLTGQSTEHLAVLCGNHRLQPEAVKAFQALQCAAKEAGFNLQPASTFRDFARQQTIWNAKFNGERAVLDENSQPLDITTLTDGELCCAILRWSALPGASRHHWGTDLDIYDPDLLPDGKKLQLEPWEYLEGGYFYPLNQWLSDNMDRFGFYRPFGDKQQGVAVEPWHLSYRPLSSLAEHQLTKEVLKKAWQDKHIAGSEWLIPHLSEIFSRFIAIK
ncbi:D,D-carboxypeptidase family protein [Hafnia paralvei ATCC 29927]|jgi:LAS superfamily LD-carboxypeptidase LdcB|uniref:Peptidase M15 n=1 Tax=Hafnia paralvei TaxID=546367 RepID=A0A2A2M901_9GAMM|nr:M15 family metallopeptidase [Hafnia paralvei]MDU1194067.1 M15 family metallopeptidase [Enterobacteriaceae bacterium]KHS44218.1 peptidase M15 [Hafnia paralvei]MBU2674935.1 M15 family metallopeptidase [Hafnia paralvei]MBW2957237.1 M15 family metallopeptidase [Hafnia paralvei]MCE9881730.1 M15 family metallopeptidase [Hafnia paralvei]